jgi:WD40 repeat protein
MLFPRNKNNVCNIAYRTFYPIVAKEASIMYPFGPSLGDISLPKNDDGSYGPINLGLPFPFFGSIYSNIYVNTNGLISFLSPISEYIPKKFPISTPSISPFWSDVNTNIGGQIYYRESSSSSDLNQAKSDITNVYSASFNPTRLYITTWYQVAAYSGSSSVNNTFQVVIATDGKLSFVIYNFGSMSWPNSLLSKDSNFGYNAGDNTNFYSHPNSFTNSITNVSLQSNVKIPGKWIFTTSAITKTTTSTTTQSKPVFNGLLLNTLTGHTNMVLGLVALPNGNLASGSNDFTIKIWNPNTGSLLYTLYGHRGSMCIILLSNGNLASATTSTGTGDTVIRIWNPNTGSLLYTLNGHSDAITVLKELPNGNLLSGSWDATIKIWNPYTGSLLYTLIGHVNCILNILILPNGNLASNSYESLIKIWNPNTRSLLFTLTGHTSMVINTRLLTNGNLASCSEDKTVKIWNPNNGLLLFTLTGHTSTVSRLAELSNGNLASGSYDRSVNIWNLNNGLLLFTLTGHSTVVSTLEILPNGNLAAGSWDMIKIWNPNTGLLLYTLNGGLYGANYFKILPNGNLASWCLQTSFNIWNPNNGSLLYTLTGHTDKINSFTILSNGNLATGSYDKNIKIWY